MAFEQISFYMINLSISLKGRGEGSWRPFVGGGGERSEGNWEVKSQNDWDLVTDSM